MFAARRAWALLPTGLAAELQKRGLTCDRPDLWRYLWDDNDERDAFIRSLGCDESDELPHVILAFDAMKEAAEKLAVKRGCAAPEDKWRGMAEAEAALQEKARAAASTSVIGELELLRALEPKAKERRKFRRGLERRLAQTEDSRAREKIEAEELSRWAAVLAKEITELGLPRALAADLSSDPRRSLLRAIGASRFRTIRARVRKWQTMRKWLMATFQCNWPAHAGQVVDYLEALATEPCGRTVPRSVIQGLSFMEEKGEVPYEKRLSNATMVKSTLLAIESQLQKDAPTVQKAPTYLVVMIVALELMVLDDGEQAYFRAYAWTLLVRV